MLNVKSEVAIMLNDEEKVTSLALEKGAADIRARVQDALKRTVEREVLRPVLMAGFSRVDHVVQPNIDLDNQNGADEQLLCIGDIDEEKFRMFVERLTELRSEA